MRISSLFSLATLVFVNSNGMPVREKIRSFLDYAASITSNAPLAIQTPHGLHPIREINEDNFLDIFGYHPTLQKEFEEAKKLRRLALAKAVSSASSSTSQQSPPAFVKVVEAPLPSKPTVSISTSSETPPPSPSSSAPRAVPTPPPSPPVFSKPSSSSSVASPAFQPGKPPLISSGYNAANDKLPPPPDFDSSAEIGERKVLEDESKVPEGSVSLSVQ